MPAVGDGHQRGAGNLFHQKFRSRRRGDLIFFPDNNQGWHRNLREDRAEIGCHNGVQGLFIRLSAQSRHGGDQPLAHGWPSALGNQDLDHLRRNVCRG